MNDRSITRIAAVFAFLSPACLFAVFPIAASLQGLGGPGPIEFGSADVLQRLRAAEPATIRVDTLALIGPALALPVGLGWYQLTKRAGSFPVLGVVLWYLGMVFVISQDTLQLSLVTRLPAAYAAANEVTRDSILVLGDAAAFLIRVQGLVGEIINSFGISLICIAMIRTSRPWLGGFGIISALTILTGVLASFFAPGSPLGPLVPIGFLIFMLWIAATGVAMLCWRPETVST